MPELAINKRAFFDYEILEKFPAGLALTGHETKSIKMGRANIAGAHAVSRNNEIFLLGMDISSFQPKNAPPDHEPQRTRKLLLKKEEIKYLTGKIQSGLTLLPIKLYTDRGLVKIELGLGRGRKKQDKREVLKKRETQKEIRKFKI
ncbi:MAG: SsrA-binding protein [Candidatus Jorgensenbacteria bacterium GW2011_GWA1_48_11]|uniref:SsrA-binding protein n=1 Tax=Candidatus Jorgensenbacteria bacterium GW2011_GWA1_48_11 TaxID=1618660 RepID=A0A0G1XB44_9BACT|nr:MAG: SsrA-binding protein [Candidatus Jorgensenbacteria bacterium GW2011_GWA1_48_11]KKW12028.1 MAG: SsrA-binding protein [Candidatus Jorgensenbacteria bacterium GW2011_GWB1_49_9]